MGTGDADKANGEKDRQDNCRNKPVKHSSAKAFARRCRDELQFGYHVRSFPCPTGMLPETPPRASPAPIVRAVDCTRASPPCRQWLQGLRLHGHCRLVQGKPGDGHPLRGQAYPPALRCAMGRTAHAVQLNPGPGPCPGRGPTSRAGSHQSRGRFPPLWVSARSVRPGRGLPRSWNPPARCLGRPVWSGGRQG